MYDNLCDKIAKEMNRKNLGRQEVEIIVRWKDEMKIKDDIIMEAVKRGKNKSIMYINAILDNWHKNDIRTYSDIIEQDKAYAEKTQKKAKNRNRFEVKVKRMTETAKMPSYGSDGAAGADLYADIEQPIYIPKGRTVMISTGISVEIPDGYVGLLFARSGLACKRGLAPANKVGVIDRDFRGTIMCAVLNHEEKSEDETEESYRERHTIQPGERIAQLAIVPYMYATFVDSDELSNTERGEGGFGSTGRG